MSGMVGYGGREVSLPFDTVLIIDDQLLFAEAIASALRRSGIDAVEHTIDLSDALRRCAQIRHGLVLIDSQDSGISAGTRILSKHPSVAVVAMSSPGIEPPLSKMKEAGFHGVLSKSAPLGEFLVALGRVGHGARIFFSNKHLTDRREQPQDKIDARLMAAQLTTRELDVLELLVEGASSDDIVNTLFIGTNTVRSHIQSILCKLQVHSRLEAATFAIRYDILASRREGQAKRSA